MTDYTRRDKQRFSKDILGRYHSLLAQIDVAGLEKLLEQYQPELSANEKQELVDDFKRYAAKILKRQWRGPK